MTNLMLIESPNKIKTIGKYVDDKDIKILATFGHLREIGKLNHKSLDIKWKPIENKTHFKTNRADIISQINKASDKSKKIYLSTDPDREGEAIAWHIYSVLSEENQAKCCRIVFNEITKQAIEEAFNNERKIDQDQVDSYLARIILDRFIGFKLSQYVYKKVGGISAGRVQSIALKFLKENKDEIDRFIPESWYQMKIVLKNGMPLMFKELSEEFKHCQLKLPKTSNISFVEKQDVESIEASLDKHWKLENIEEIKQEKVSAPTALETSTLLTSAVKKLGFNAKKAEKTAQTLYEGVEINGENVSLITYPRTDRTDFSQTFLAVAKDYIINEYSVEYWSGPTTKRAKKDLVQGAHEGIRPTDLTLTPESVCDFLSPDAYKLYKLIWSYALCSLMSSAVFENQSYKFNNNNHIFKGNIRSLIFDGYQKLMLHYYPQTSDDLLLDKKDLIAGNLYDASEVKVATINKQPPSPHSEATLISALKEKGIGRPSTYASMADIVINRHYAIKEQNKLIISDLGCKVAADLDDNFSSFINYDYTTNMEKELDDISESKKNWKEFLHVVMGDFENILTQATETIVEKELDIVPDRTCEKCQGNLVFRVARKTNIKFIACSNFPSCNHTEYLNKEEGLGELEQKCPDCQKPLRRIKNKWDKFFVSCSGYPKCKYIENSNPPKLLDTKCPNCSKPLREMMNRWNVPFTSCSGYPECRYIDKTNQPKPKVLDEQCPKCQKNLHEKLNKKNELFVSCPGYPKCKYIHKNSAKTKTSNS